MFRKMYGVAALGLMFVASAVLAGEVKGKLTKVDADGSKITISVDGKDNEYAVAKDCKMYKYKTKDGEKEATLKSLHTYLEKSKAGVDISVVTTKKDDKEVVTEIKSAERKGKEKKDK